MVNTYDNWIGGGHVYERNWQEKRRKIEDAERSKVIKNRTISVGNFNAHSRE